SCVGPSSQAASSNAAATADAMPKAGLRFIGGSLRRKGRTIYPPHRGRRGDVRCSGVPTLYRGRCRRRWLRVPYIHDCLYERCCGGSVRENPSTVGTPALRRTKEDARQTRERILDAAERVFFERGVARTT